MPSVIVQATIRPAAGATNILRLPSMRVWNAVVREITSHGLVGQLGVAAAVVWPISMIRAEATPGTMRTAASAARRGPSHGPVHARIEHERAVKVAVGAVATPVHRPACRQTFCTLTAFGPFSPFSSSYVTFAPSGSER